MYVVEFTVACFGVLVTRIVDSGSAIAGEVTEAFCNPAKVVFEKVCACVRRARKLRRVSAMSKRAFRDMVY